MQKRHIELYFRALAHKTVCIMLWHTVGGTSALTPQLVALIALTNQKADMLLKPHHVGCFNPLLYTLSPSDFNDIVPQSFGPVTIDNNDPYGSGVTGYATTPGYDLTTRFGSPNAPNFRPGHSQRNTLVTAHSNLTTLPSLFPLPGGYL